MDFSALIEAGSEAEGPGAALPCPASGFGVSAALTPAVQQQPLRRHHVRIDVEKASVSPLMDCL